MAKTLTIQMSDDLEQALNLQAQRLNKSPEDVVVELLSQQLPPAIQLAVSSTRHSNQLYRR